MLKLQDIAGTIKRYLLRPRVIWCFGICLIIALGIGITWRDARSRSHKEQQALTKLAQQQKTKAKQQNTSARTHQDIDNTLFSDTSEGTFKRPTCARLENRPGIIISNGCNYTIRALGKLTMAVVFVYDGPFDPHYNDLLRGSEEAPTSLRYINTYLRNQSGRFKVTDPAQLEMSFFGPYQTSDPVANIYYRDNGTSLLEIYNKTSKANSVPEENYDMVHFVFLNQVYGGMAFPGLHRAFTYNSSTVGVFVHETLHLLGATDKYNNNDCNSIGQSDPFGRYNGTLPGKDIMCESISLESSNINDITAREIGWKN